MATGFSCCGMEYCQQYCQPHFLAREMSYVLSSLSQSRFSHPVPVLKTEHCLFSISLLKETTHLTVNCI